MVRVCVGIKLVSMIGVEICGEFIGEEVREEVNVLFYILWERLVFYFVFCR